MVHGDKDWARDYEKMSEDIVWSGVEDITEPADGDHMEEEAMIDRVVVSHNGNIILGYCQVVATGPGSGLDQIIAKEEDPSQYEPLRQPTRSMRPANLTKQGLGIWEQMRLMGTLFLRHG